MIRMYWKGDDISQLYKHDPTPNTKGLHWKTTLEQFVLLCILKYVLLCDILFEDLCGNSWWERYVDTSMTRRLHVQTPTAGQGQAYTSRVVSWFWVLIAVRTQNRDYSIGLEWWSHIWIPMVFSAWDFTIPMLQSHEWVQCVIQNQDYSTYTEIVKWL